MTSQFPNQRKKKQQKSAPSLACPQYRMERIIPSTRKKMQDPRTHAMALGARREEEEKKKRRDMHMVDEEREREREKETMRE